MDTSTTRGEGAALTTLVAGEKRRAEHGGKS